MLKVGGIDPKRITCEVYKDGVSHVYLDGDYVIARLDDHGPVFDGSWAGDFRRDAQAVMNAAIDEWRASGGKRLWPEPPPEPVDCVCGGKARIQPFGHMRYVMCDLCCWSGPKADRSCETVAIAWWNDVMIPALKANQEATR